MGLVKKIVRQIRISLRTIFGGRRGFRQRTFPIGIGEMSGKALEYAAALEDQEILRKISIGK